MMRLACYAGYLARFRPRDDVDSRFVAYWMQIDAPTGIDRHGQSRSTIENFYRE